MENKLTTTDTGALTSLKIIEFRMDRALQDLRTGYLELGRCLIEAKEAQLVPHGQWEAWVREHACMSERQAQKLMQIARTVESGTALARLDISKIQTLLALPEGQREELAERAEAENLTLRELRDQVQQLKGERDRYFNEKTVAYGAGYSEGSKKGRTSADAHVRQLEDLLAAEKKSHARDQATAGSMVNGLETRIQMLEKQLSEQPDPNKELYREIEKLQGDLSRATEYAKRQAELRKEAQEKLLSYEQDQSRGSGSRGSVDFGASVRRFIGEVGVLQHMGSDIAAWPKNRRGELKMYLDTVETWLHNTRKALSVIPSGGDDYE